MTRIQQPSECVFKHTAQASAACILDRLKDQKEWVMLGPRNNELLDQLNDCEGQSVFQNLHLVSLTDGQQLYAPGDLIDQVYFPLTALIAIAKEMKDGVSIDVALVGREGGVGFRGMISRCPNRVYVASSGLAYQISLRQLQQIEKYQISLREHHSLEDASTWLTRMYVHSTHTVFDNIAAETACAHFHSTTERLARWLLTRYERGQSKHIHTTHQKIADSLGVRREAVTNALLKLKGIKQSRSLIEVQDFAVLETQSCDCYGVLSRSWSEQLTLPFRGHF